MRYAVPTTQGKLSAHFGHCEHFAIIDADEATGTVANKQLLAAPPHQPGLLPVWLAEQGVAIVIAGGMGSRAQGIFTENRITVIVGAHEGDPEEVVVAYIRGALTTGENVCDH